MSCAEVMYHPQSYGATQYLPNSVAAAACPTTYYHTAPQSSQQKKLAVYSKMQESLEMTLPSKQEEEEEDEDEEEEEEEEEEKDQPAEMEYLNSRCVLFTYFQGDIGSVVDEHFSRALGQASSFPTESTIPKSKMGLTPLWRESSTLSNQRNSFPTSFWTSSYQPPTRPCLSGVHPDFSVTAPGTFAAADPGPWSGHNLHQTAPPPPPVSESWHYPLTSQVSPSYTHMHDVYMHHHHPHPHMHHRHHHHPSASSHLDPRYGSLLMPSVRTARIPAPQCDITKTDPTTVTTATSAWAGAFHGTVDIVPSFGFDSGLQHQDKSKESPWF